MAKNKGTYGKAKSDVELEDEFVQSAGKVATALAPHQTKIIILGLLILAAAIAWATWDWYHSKQVRARTQEVSDGFLLAVGAVKSEAGDAAPAGGEQFDSPAARDQAALAALDDVAMKQKLLVEANLALRAGRHEMARDKFKAFLSTDAPERTKVMAREGIGYAEEARATAAEDPQARQQALEGALAAFEKMQPDPEGPLHRRAIYHQGRILAQLGRNDEALAKFKEILNGDPGDLAPAVEYRIAALEAGTGAPAGGSPAPAPGGTDQKTGSQESGADDPGAGARDVGGAPDDRRPTKGAAPGGPGGEGAVPQDSDTETPPEEEDDGVDMDQN